MPPQYNAVDGTDPNVIDVVKGKPISFNKERFWTVQQLDAVHLTSAPSQFVPLLEKLDRGEGITVLAFGSSVTANMGGCFHSSIEAIQRSVAHMPDVYMGRSCRKGVGGWLNHFMQSINQTWPHVNHTLINAGRPAASIENIVLAACFEHYIPPSMDLLIIENMLGVGPPAGVEVMVWRVLHKLGLARVNGTRPAIIIIDSAQVVFESPEFRHDDNCVRNIEMCTSSCSAPGAFNHTCDGPTLAKHNDAPIALLGSYYGFSVLSYRAFLSAMFRDGMPSMLGVSDCAMLSLLQGDGVHPRELGTVLWGDFFWSVLRNAEEYVAARQAQQSQVLGQAGRALLNAAEVEAAARAAVTATAAAAVAARAPGLQLPRIPQKAMFKTGRALRLDRCYMYEHFSAATDQRMAKEPPLDFTERQGWEYHLFTTHTEIARFKPGWVATTPGSVMAFAVDTHFPGAVPNTTEVVVMFLTSWEHMGTARLSCVSGCECPPAVMNGHRGKDTVPEDQRAFSLSSTLVHHVTESPRCVLRFEVLPGTDSGQHKFKIITVNVRATPSYETVV